MVWAMAAMAAISTISSIEKSKAEAEAMLADSQLQRERLDYARQRQQETYQRNKANVDRAESRNALAIEKSRLQAESELSSSLAGSGIGGVSVGELSTEIQTDAAEAHNDNIRMADDTDTMLFLERRNTLEDNEFLIKQMGEFDAQAAATGAVLQGVASGVSTGIQTGAISPKGGKGAK